MEKGFFNTGRLTSDRRSVATFTFCPKRFATGDTLTLGEEYLLEVGKITYKRFLWIKHSHKIEIEVNRKRET